MLKALSHKQLQLSGTMINGPSVGRVHQCNSEMTVLLRAFSASGGLMLDRGPNATFEQHTE